MYTATFWKRILLQIFKGCIAGQFCDGDICRACPDGTFKAEMFHNDTSCDDCNCLGCKYEFHYFTIKLHLHEANEKAKVKFV